MSTSIYIWVRSIRSLQHFLAPLNSSFSAIFGVCQELAHLQNDVSLEHFLELCQRAGLAESIGEAVFEMSLPDRNYSTLCVGLLYVGFQKAGISNLTRAELILENFREVFNAEIFEFMKKLGILDEFFEGTVKSTSNRSCVRPISQILPTFEEENVEREEIYSRILSCLILDPYRIDELPFDRLRIAKLSNEAPRSFRRTTLAHNSRRVVHLHNVNKLELLRKDDFANIHLRICHDKPKASFIFAVVSLETVILDSLQFCRTIVLGAVRGTVVVSNCRFFRLTVACDQIHLINCQHLEVYCMSRKRPTVTNCEVIEFAPLNTTYMSHSEFLDYCGLDFEMNRSPKEPINLGNSAWKFMEPAKFICQLTPVQTKDKDIDFMLIWSSSIEPDPEKHMCHVANFETPDKDFESLLYSLPEIYRRAAHNNTIEARKRLNSSNLRLADVISNRDLIYLKSKREPEEENLQ